MNLWKKLFNPTKKNNIALKHPISKQKSVDSPEVVFAEVFSTKGGKFIFSENLDQSKKYLDLILQENKWKPENVVCFDSVLAKRFEQPRKPFERNINHYPAMLVCSEFLISKTGGILFSEHQIKNFRKDILPKNLIVFAKVNQFAQDLTDAMVKINQKYPNTKPCNLTTIQVDNLGEEISEAHKRNNSKNIYLLLEDIQKE